MTTNTFLSLGRFAPQHTVHLHCRQLRLKQVVAAVELAALLNIQGAAFELTAFCTCIDYLVLGVGSWLQPQSSCWSDSSVVRYALSFH
jgi:hypothetical protein